MKVSKAEISGKLAQLKADKQLANDGRKLFMNVKRFAIAVFRWVIIIGICYVILGPVIGIISSSFFSKSDAYNPMVYLLPQNPTLERYQGAWTVMKYGKTIFMTLGYDLSLMVIQVLVCSMVGYGFARFEFPFKKLLFGLVVVMIVLPTNTIMLPLYMTFRNFGPTDINLLGTPIPMYIMTFLGCGLRSGLYIYIFNQFFRGLPKEIEEAAFVDGAGMWYTYLRIMLVNAIPSVITVSIFSMVWQYNDTFYGNLFKINSDMTIGRKITSLPANISKVFEITDPTITKLYTYAGIVLVILPVVIVYVALQKYFIEGVERSGIVG